MNLFSTTLRLLSAACALNSLIASFGLVILSNALFHVPEWMGVWLTLVRLTLNASSAGQTFLHAPQ
jgi:hypothetical protein